MPSLLETIKEKLQNNVTCPKLLVVSGSVCLGYVVSEWITKNRAQSKIRAKIQKKKQETKSAFAEVEQSLQQWQLPTEEYERIINLPILELQQELQNGNISALDVLHVYQSKTLTVDKKVNGVTEPLLDAMVLAAECDTTTGIKGPLHGVPVSIKEVFNLDGHDTTIGMGGLIGDLQTEDAVLIKVLKSQGAVPFVRTNIPQTMQSNECCNPIYGKTVNPYDVNRGPGGSTSGEGALIGARASILGFGSDRGGSIRIPAHMCGCYGLSPTAGRLSSKGLGGLSNGQTLVTSTVGPMSRDLEGLVVSMKALLCDYHFQLDPQVPPIYFRDEIYENKRPLRVGFYDNDGYIQPVPACQRAVYMAKQALEAQGHTVVPFTPPNIGYVVADLFIRTTRGDKSKMFLSKMRHEVLDPNIKKTFLLSKFPNIFITLLAYIVGLLTKDENDVALIKSFRGCSSVYEWFVQANKLQVYKDTFLSLWKAKDLDAVICPVYACTAIPHGQGMSVIAGGSYCMLYNVLNYPAASLPITKVTNEDIHNMKQYPDKTALQRNIRMVTKGSEGLPVGVQCVGLPFQEEMVLRLMKEVETGLTKLEQKCNQCYKI